MVQNPGGPKSLHFEHSFSQKPLFLYFSFSFYTFFILFLYFFILFYTFPMVFQWLYPKSIKTLSKSIKRCSKSIETLSKSIKTRFWACQDGPKSVIWSPGPAGSSFLSRNCNPELEMMIWSSSVCMIKSETQDHHF